MFQISSCTEHEWVEESAAFKEDLHYGSGLMQQRRCHKCSTTEYTRFVSDQGIVTDIETPLVKAGIRGWKVKIGDNVVGVGTAVSFADAAGIDRTLVYDFCPPAEHQASSYTFELTRTSAWPPTGATELKVLLEPSEVHEPLAKEKGQQ